jgi:heme A synthase
MSFHVIAECAAFGTAAIMLAGTAIGLAMGKARTRDARLQVWALLSFVGVEVTMGLGDLSDGSRSKVRLAGLTLALLAFLALFVYFSVRSIRATRKARVQALDIGPAARSVD